MRSRGLFYIFGAVFGGAVAWLSGLEDTSVATITVCCGLAALKAAEGAGCVAPPEKPFRPTILFHRE